MNSQWEHRSNNFDFLRLALAVLVIYSHSYPLGTGSEMAEPVRRLTHGQMTGGGIAVDLFFVMSGFLISGSAERSRSSLRFIKKRVARIYPAFCVAALVTLSIVMPLAGARFEYAGRLERAGDFLLQTLRLREFSYASGFAGNPYPGSLNGSAWSIQYEFWCYVGVALLASSGMLHRRWLILGLFISSLSLSVCFETERWRLGGKLLGVLLGSPQLWARLLPLYLAGVVFYLFRERIPRLPWMAAAAVIVLVLAARLPLGCTALFPVAGTYLILYLAYAPWLRLQRFGRYGDFSYGTYLYAFPVQQTLMRGFGHPVAPWHLFLCATPPTLALAAASWYGVERRFLQPARRKETLLHAMEQAPEEST